ncbi:MAG: peptidylprolyl isomerase [archaeon]|nr:MAG: peptidylprolyl isomerase [archaeon]
MKKGDFVKIEYTAKVKETGKIFDTTKEDVAKKEELFNPKINYGPVLFIIGSEKTVKGLDEELLKMKLGEKKVVEIPPEKGFGKRNPEMLKLLPLSEFKKQNITPYPGMILSMEGINCRVISVNSGRVRVDFKHPLAGKTLVYDLKISGKLEKSEEKIEAVCEYYNCEYKKVVIKERKVDILIKNEIDEKNKKLITDDIFDNMNFDKIEFSQIFERKN